MYVQSGQHAVADHASWRVFIMPWQGVRPASPRYNAPCQPSLTPETPFPLLLWPCQTRASSIVRGQRAHLTMNTITHHLALAQRRAIRARRCILSLDCASLRGLMARAAANPLRPTHPTGSVRHRAHHGPVKRLSNLRTRRPSKTGSTNRSI